MTAVRWGGSRPGVATYMLVVARREVWSAPSVGWTGEVGGVRGVEAILFLVVLGTVVAAFAGRLRVPAPAGLAR
jgi:hypothetical protein